jgi:type VI secretion system secreted protein VgrG
MAEATTRGMNSQARNSSVAGTGTGSGTSAYSQASRALQVTTPLGDDVLLITAFSGFESISRLFRFHLTLAAPDQTQVDFNQLMGGSVTTSLRLPDGSWRYFNGICSSLTQSVRQQSFTFYEMEVVPYFWRLTQNYQSRIFQYLSVPEILQQVLADVPKVTFDVTGNFQPREYCVQYRESDHDFACRLMEEEGIFFYFNHSSGQHEMVVTNKQSFPTVDPAQVVLQPVENKVDDVPRVTEWQVQQRMQSGRVTLRDHTFELPHDHIQGASTIQDSVAVGKVTHELSAGQSTSMEAYDWPGAYARRFDSIDRSGNMIGQSELAKIPPDGQRTTGIRMQQIAAGTITIVGQSNCRQLASGHSFSIQEIPIVPYNGSSSVNGQYVLTSVDHRCELSVEYRSGDAQTRFYENRFTCIPSGLPYSPSRLTPRPVIQGPQTAVVVKGPGGDEIFTDPYGRVKVQFHWDRSGDPNPESSCWIRVAHHNSGSGFGMIYIPRGDQEVIVQFEEGDPDRPIITGSVYNPNLMPMYELPAKKMVSGFRSNTYPGGGGNNEISVDDTKGNELIYMHAQHNKNMIVNNDRTESVGNDVTESVGNNKTVSIQNDVSKSVGNNKTEQVGNNKTVGVSNDHNEFIGNNQTQSVGANQTNSIGGNQTTSVAMNKTETVLMSSNEMVGAAKTTTVGGAYVLTVAGAMNTAVGMTSMEEVGQTKTVIVGNKLVLSCGAGSITIDSSGKVTISGTEFVFQALGHVQISGSIIDLN